MKEKEAQADELYKKASEENNLEKMVILGHWVDYIEELLCWKLLECLEEHGIDPETDDDFEITEEMEAEMVISQEDAEIELQNREKFYKEHPYGTCRNQYYLKGIYLEKLERDILKWVLDKE